MNQGPAEIINWYENNADENSPYWSLWIGKQLMGSVGTGELDEAKDKLLKNIQFIYSNPQPGKFTLKLHDDQGGKRINDKTDYYSSFNFYPATGNQLAGIGSAGMEFPNNPNMQLMYNKIVALESDNQALRAMMTEPDGEEEEANTVGNVPVNPFMDFINNPEVIKALIPRVMGLIDNILPAAKAADQDNDQRIGSMGNIPGVDPLDQYNKANQAVRMLAQHDDKIGDDLMILVKIADNDPNKFNMVLDILRANG